MEKSRWVCGLISPAGVSQAWREQAGGAGGPQLFVLEMQGKDSLSAPLSKERMANGVYSGGPGALELEPKHGGGECLLCFPTRAPPWGVARSQEVPWAWAGAQPHPDKGQLWGCDGHSGQPGPGIGRHQERIRGWEEGPRGHSIWAATGQSARDWEDKKVPVRGARGEQRHASGV